MKILLLSATQFEIQPFLQTAPKMDVLIGGVGVPATVFQLTRQLHHHHYDLVIQAGIAGAFQFENFEPGEVVVVKKDCFADLGLLENNIFQSVQEMGFSNEPEWLVNDHPVLQKTGFKQVNAITVNTITDSENMTSARLQKWEAAIESMEGAALHYVCRQQHIPFLQLRSISNQVGVRDKTRWVMKQAIENLNEALSQLRVER